MAEVLAAFGAELEVQRKLAGRHVTYKWLAEASRAQRGVPLPQSSVWRLFKGQVPEPDWSVIEQVLRLCRVPEQVIAEKWRPRWAALISEIHAFGQATTGIPAQHGTECPTCGALVLNENRHRQYHADLEAYHEYRAEQEVQRRRRAIRPVPSPMAG